MAQYNPYPPANNYYPYPQQQYVDYNPTAYRLQELERANQQYGQAMPQQYMPQMMPQQAAQPTAPQGPQVMAVNSEQEARQYQTDLSGVTQIFVNKSTNQIYAKQFDVSDATVKFEVYEKATPNVAVTQPAPQDNPLISTILNGFTGQLDTISNEIKSLKEMINHGNQPTGNSITTSKQQPSNAANNAASAGDGADGK